MFFKFLFIIYHYYYRYRDLFGTGSKGLCSGRVGWEFCCSLGGVGAWIV